MLRPDSGGSDTGIVKANTAMLAGLPVGCKPVVHYQTRIVYACCRDFERTKLAVMQWKALCLALASLSLAAQPVPPAIDIRTLKADLTFLTSKPLAGRLSLQPGSEVAIEWIAAEYAKAGLKPAGGGSYIQPVPLIEFFPDRTASALTVTAKGTAQEFKAPDASITFPQDFDLAGDVVFAGYGITAPELNYDDYRGLDVRGKIVLVFDHEPQENDPASIFNGTGNTRYATSRVKLLNAQAHGAIAVLQVAEPNRKHPSNQERQARIPGSAVRSRRMPSQVIEGDEVQIPLVVVSDKVAADLIAAAGKKATEVQSAIDATLTPASMALPGVHVALCNRNRERRRGDSANLIGLVEGSDPQLKNEVVVISAHYDHDGAWPEGYFPGADDNGSGTVGVVALARAFANSPVKPKRSVLFAIFAAEERGLLGSYYYAQHPLVPLAQTRAVINFDLIGGNEAPSNQTQGLIEIEPDTTNLLNIVGLKYSPDYKSAVERANGQVGLQLSYKWDEEAALNVYFRSDQFPFALKGIPAMWWFTGFHPDYHQMTDTVDKINFEKMAKILRLAYLTGWDFADSDRPVRFIANPAAPR